METHPEGWSQLESETFTANIRDGISDEAVDPQEHLTEIIVYDDSDFPHGKMIKVTRRELEERIGRQGRR